MNQIASKLPALSLFFILGVTFFDFSVKFVLTQPLTYILLFFVGVYAVTELVDLKKLKQFKKYSSIFNHLSKYSSIVFSIAVSLSISLYLFLPNTAAEWSFVDDHQIMSYFGSDRVVSWTELPHLLSATEVAEYGKSLRFRPVYFVLRISEAVIWGNNPTAWYGFRLLLLITSLAIYHQLLKRYISAIPAALLIVFFMTYTTWADMFARLGPSETYTVFSFALFLLGFQQVFVALKEDHKPKHTSLLLLLSGSVISIGSKENFLLLLLPLIFITGYAAYRKVRYIGFWVVTTLAVAFGMYVAGGVVLGLLSSKVDVYGNATTTDSRASVLLLGLKHTSSKIMMITSALTGSMYVLQRLFLKKSSLLVILKNTTLATMTFLAIFLSQFVFYNANWPDGSRYDFPGVFVIPLFYLTVTITALHVLKDAGIKKIYLTMLIIGLLTGLSFLTVMKNFVSTQVRVKENVTLTKEYTSEILSAAQFISEHPNLPVIMQTTSPGEFERTYSVAAFLQAYGVENPIYLQLVKFPAELTGLDAQLANTLRYTSEHGSDAFLPLPERVDSCVFIRTSSVPTLSIKESCHGFSQEL